MDMEGNGVVSGDARRSRGRAHAQCASLALSQLAISEAAIGVRYVNEEGQLRDAIRLSEHRLRLGVVERE